VGTTSVTANAKFLAGDRMAALAIMVLTLAAIWI
jgi:hypothetical protein